MVQICDQLRVSKESIEDTIDLFDLPLQIDAPAEQLECEENSVSIVRQLTFLACDESVDEIEINCL